MKKRLLKRNAAALLTLMLCLFLAGCVGNQETVLTIGVYSGSYWNTPNGNSYQILDDVILDFGKERQAAEQSRNALRIKTKSVDAGVTTLSGGNQQKVVLGKWMFAQPEVLILDEPTRSIDVGAKYEIYRLIHEMADQGKAVILVSSELPELLGMSDRIYTICEGSITGVIDSKDADQEKLMRLMTTTSDVKA